MVDLDELFPHIGEYGKFQKIMLWLILFPLLFVSCFTTFNQIFMSDEPKHWCRVPELEYMNDSARRFLSIPKKDKNYEKCLRYNVNWTEIINNNISTPNISWPVQSCLDGWEFNTSQISSSIVIDKSMYPTFGLVFLNLGGPIGIFVFGLINDRYGRKLSLLICLSVTILTNILTAFSPNMIFWMVTRLMLGTTMPALYHIVFILALEIVGQNYRAWVSVMSCLVFTIGLMMLAGITYLVPQWRYLAIISTAPFSAYILILCFIPESPRWLMARNRHVEAFKVLKNIARINRKQVPESLINNKEMVPLHTEQQGKTHKKNVTILDLFKTPNMRIKTILISFNWFVNEIVYLGLSWSSPTLGPNKYFSFFLGGFVEIPGILLCKYVLDIWGRRLPFSILMIMSGIFCIITVLVPSDTITILILSLASKFAISSSFLIIYTYAGELYPTDARGLGLAMSGYCSGIGRVFLPFVTDLGKETVVLPLVILGILAVIGGISSLRLPETLHQPLPQTIPEGEEFGKNMSFFKCKDKIEN